MKPCLLFTVTALSICIGRAAAPDLSSFQIDPRLEIRLFASESDVVDPVALTFDESGRMYVVEMRDYPYGIGPEKKPGGTIRLLEDTDEDGKADKSTVFTRDLSFPTSIAPWRGGVFVTAPPEIIFLRDTTGDGVADEREVYFTGFTRGVTDSNVNGLRWGLDNRLHGSNGGNGGRIVTQINGRPTTAVELRDRDFSFDPATRDFKPTYQTSAGFGLVFDEYGRSFTTYNINHIQQRILPERYLRRFPGMPPVEGTRSISDHGEMARIFPISVAQTRPNHPEQAGHFSAAGGLGFIGHDAYPEDLYQSVTVGDVVGNLIHRDVLVPDGAIFSARRAAGEESREFLASRDPACRLVGLELGPDGALYAIDMQRDVIEHPDYIPEKMRQTLNLRAGEDRGRIYRITPRQGLPKSTINLAGATAQQLVAELESRNQWRRATAQRLLVEKRGHSMRDHLSAIARQSKYGPGRVHALWTLHALGWLPENIVSDAIRDSAAGVRINALQIAEQMQTRIYPFSDFYNRLTRVAEDSSLEVRMQLALTLGEFTSDKAESALHKVLFANATNYWIRTAALTSIKTPVATLSVVLNRTGSTHEPGHLELTHDLANLAMTRSDSPAAALMEILNALQPRSGPVVTAALQGLEAGLQRRGGLEQRLRVQAVLTRLAEKSAESFVAAWRIGQRLGYAATAEQLAALEKAAARATNGLPGERIEAFRLLQLGSYTQVAATLLRNLGGSVPTAVQSEALRVLSAFREPELAQALVERWPELSPSLRTGALNLLISRKPFHNALVTAIETGRLTLGELNLDLEQRRALLRRGTADIQARAAKLISDEEYSNRKALVEEWLGRLPAVGDAARGKAHFEKLCAQCHKVAGTGANTGPDLTSVSHRSVEDLLSNILDPNMAINPKYATMQIETKSGDLITGIVQEETADSITLIQANDLQSTVARTEITKLRSTGASLMPEGLEAGLSPEDLRDLIAYLQQPPK